jgi:hypothetical protein
VADDAADTAADLSWRPSLLLDAARIATWRGPIPRQTAPLAQVRPGGKGAWICTVSGGVEVRPDDLVQQAEALGETSPLARLPAAPADPNRWWWDAPSVASNAK